LAEARRVGGLDAEIAAAKKELKQKQEAKRKLAAAEAKALADQKAVEEKAAAEAKALADQKAVEEKAAAEAKALADQKAVEEKAAAEAKPAFILGDPAAPLLAAAKTNLFKFGIPAAVETKPLADMKDPPYAWFITSVGLSEDDDIPGIVAQLKKLGVGTFEDLELCEPGELEVHAAPYRYVLIITAPCS
jgi:hypothetical protein